MENKKCKNKDCQRTLPLGYKHKYCENCRNNQSHRLKQALKVIAITVGGSALTIISFGKIRPKK